MDKNERLSVLKNANLLFRQGDAEGALVEFKKILSVYPSDINVRRIVGDIYLKQKNIPAAVVQFQRIADFYSETNAFPRAIAVYRRIIRFAPEDENTLIKLAELYARVGMDTEAHFTYQKLAECFLRQNDRKRARIALRKILEAGKDFNTKIPIHLAHSYLAENMQAEAMEIYLTTGQRLMELEMFAATEELLFNGLQRIKHPDILKRLMECYFSRGKGYKALELMTHLGEGFWQIQPEDAGILKNLGDLCMQKNLLPEAERLLTRCRQIAPRDSECLEKLGRFYIHTQDFDKAYRLFLPFVDHAIKVKSFKNAAYWLRILISNNNSYLPALIKMSHIYRHAGQKKHLVSLYQSLVPLLEKRGLKDQLIKVLEDLVQWSDNPQPYNEKLQRLKGANQVKFGKIPPPSPFSPPAPASPPSPASPSSPSPVTQAATEVFSPPVVRDEIDSMFSSSGEDVEEEEHDPREDSLEIEFHDPAHPNPSNPFG